MLFAPRSGVGTRSHSRHRHHHHHQSRSSKETLLRFAKRHDKLIIFLAVLLSAVLAAWLAGLIANAPTAPLEY